MERSAHQVGPKCSWRGGRRAESGFPAESKVCEKKARLVQMNQARVIGSGGGI